MKDSGMDLSALIKWHLKRASRLKKWVDTIKIIEGYPMFAKVKFRNEWSKKVIRGMRVTNLLKKEYIDGFVNGKRYGKIRGITVEIKNPTDLATTKTLIEIKEQIK